MATIRTVLGEERPIVDYAPDGTPACPFCGYWILAGVATCQNPACDASPWWSPETLSSRNAELAKKNEEERIRRDQHKEAIERIEEQRREQADRIDSLRAECNRRGACWRCCDPYRPKFIRHRGECPKARVAFRNLYY